MGNNAPRVILGERKTDSWKDNKGYKDDSKEGERKQTPLNSPSTFGSLNVASSAVGGGKRGVLE